MIAFLLSLTIRQQVWRKSTLLLLGLALLPVLVALLFRLTDNNDDPQTWTSEVLYRGLIVTAVLPLTALMFGTSVIGDELEDGTAIYLLTKPIPRWEILLPKLIAPWLLTAAILAASTLVSGLVAIESGGREVVYGAAFAMLLGSLVYTTLFVMLSIVSSHALIIGLVYVFIWEGAVAGLFEGVRYLSVRHYTIGVADWASGHVPETFDAYIGGVTSLVLMAIVTVLSGLFANQRLQRAEIRERP
jgi:ABC-2 type transport system permease protein